jgi:hypothetical protein
MHDNSFSNFTATLMLFMTSFILNAVPYLQLSALVITIIAGITTINKNIKK